MDPQKNFKFCQKSFNHSKPETAHHLDMVNSLPKFQQFAQVSKISFLWFQKGQRQMDRKKMVIIYILSYEGIKITVEML